MWAQDEAKAGAKSPTPAQQYQALLKEYQAAMKAFQEASQNAKTPEEQQKAFQEKYPKKSALAPKFIELAEKNSKDPVALEALLWVVTDNFGPPDNSSASAKAIALLIRDHIQSEKLGRACQSMTNGFDADGIKLLRAIVEKNPHKDVQAEASLALAQRLRQQAEFIEELKKTPANAAVYESYFGKDNVAELLKGDAAKIEAEADRQFQEFADKHVPQMKADRLAIVCQSLTYSRGKAGESLLRTLLEKDARREVQGVACLALGQMLKARADQLPVADKSAAEVRAESEQLLERAQEKFADVKMSYYGTVGAKAKAELFDLRNLAVGKVAPEVEGIDQDGQKFKLTDYRGKVVFLDFWSQY